jgi:hypothetical protein
MADTHPKVSSMALTFGEYFHGSSFLVIMIYVQCF